MLKLAKLNPEIYRKPMAFEPVSQPGIQPMRRPGSRVEKRRRKLNRLAEKGVNLVDDATRLPGKISDLGDRLNDKFISVAKDLQAATEKFSNQGAAVAEKNLKENKIQSLGRQAFSWIQNNMAIAAGVGLVVAFLIYRGVTK